MLHCTTMHHCSRTQRTCELALKRLQAPLFVGSKQLALVDSLGLDLHGRQETRAHVVERGGEGA